MFSCFMPYFLHLDLLFPMFLMLDPQASISHTMCFCLDSSFPCVVWLDPRVSMLVYTSICLSYMLYAMFRSFFSYGLMSGSTCAYAWYHVYGYALLCMHVLCSYAYVYAFTCLHAWICVLLCFYAYIHMLRCTFPCPHAYFHAYMCRLVCLHA